MIYLLVFPNPVLRGIEAIYLFLCSSFQSISPNIWHESIGRWERTKIWTMVWGSPRVGLRIPGWGYHDLSWRNDIPSKLKKGPPLHERSDSCWLQCHVHHHQSSELTEALSRLHSTVLVFTNDAVLGCWLVFDNRMDHKHNGSDVPLPSGDVKRAVFAWWLHGHLAREKDGGLDQRPTCPFKSVVIMKQWINNLYKQCFHYETIYFELGWICVIKLVSLCGLICCFIHAWHLKANRSVQFGCR